MPIIKNLFAGLRFAFFQRVDAGVFRFRPIEVLALLAVNIFIGAVGELVLWWPVAGILPWGATAEIARWSILLMALFVGSLLVAQGVRFPEILLMVLAALPATTLIWLAIAFYVPWQEIPRDAAWALWIGYSLWIFVIVTRAAMTITGIRLDQGSVPAILFVGAGLVSIVWPGQVPLFRQAVDQAATGGRTYSALDVETLYYAQPVLMADATKNIRPGTEGKTEVFALVVAYYPHQSVFLREADAVTRIVTEGFGAEGRVVTLANSERDPMRYPMANQRNLRTALDALAARMNNGEDILFVYLVSHGSEEVLSAGYWDAGTPPLSGAELSLLLDQSGLENIVAVIGACKSGSFLPKIQRSDRLIITASAADRNSFGCGEDNEWTYFGEAFFDVALRETTDFNSAFDRAVEIVTSRERAGGHKPSQPQRVIGAKIGRALDALRADLRTR